MSNGPLPLSRARPLTGDNLRTQRTLAEYPTEMVNLACSRCDRTGRLSKARLLAEHGPGVGLVNLLNRLRPADCPLNVTNLMTGGNDCGIRYCDLTR